MTNMPNDKFEWANDKSREYLNAGYLQEGQSLEERVWEIAKHAEKLTKIDGFAKKFFYYMSKGYYSLSSPVWSNYGTTRGLPVSCFGTYIGDSIPSILEGVAEVGTMSKHGGGCSGYFGDVRGRGSIIGNNNGKSFGAVHFMELFDKESDVISQGSVRRGFFSPYLPIEHDDAMEFMAIGTEGHPIQQLTNGVTVTDDFLEEMIEGDSEKRKRWAKLIQNRGEVGYPYILFSDTVNRNTVDVYKDKGLKIYASNMCSEIALPSNEDESFVCVLSSMNILYYDNWKNTDAVETLTYFLDSVITEFLMKLESMRDSSSRELTKTFEFMSRAYNFAKRHRALGLGTLGWHHYLQSKMIAFESDEAMKLNVEVHRTIKEKSWAASKEMAEIYGEPEILKGYGRRNTTLTAIAPTKSSSYILGQVSQSIEPELQNVYIKDLAKSKVTIYNPYLKELLASKYGKDDEETWAIIKRNDGSVQKLDFLSEHEKNVFKKFSEISPYTIINQAADRQKEIDQSQSLNLMINSNLPTKEINKIYLYAWEMGVKSLYYQKSTNAAQDMARERACASCEA